MSDIVAESNRELDRLEEIGPMLASISRYSVHEATVLVTAIYLCRPVAEIAALLVHSAEADRRMMLAGYPVEVTDWDAVRSALEGIRFGPPLI